MARNPTVCNSFFSRVFFFAEHENKDGGVVPGEVGVVFAGLCFLLGGDNVVLGHEHTPGNAATSTDLAFSAACLSRTCLFVPPV